MAHTKATVVFVLVLISFTYAQLDVNLNTTTETPIDPTTASTITEITDVTTPTTTTTEASTTLSTTSTTPSTTTSPTTTTVVPPTTVAPSPAPKPMPEYKKWSWPVNTNETCVIIQLAVQLNLTYKTVDDKSSNILYNVPVANSKVINGSCGNVSQSITVQFGNASEMMLTFKVNDTTSQFMLSEIDLFINASAEFSDAEADQMIKLYHTNDDFTTPLAMSYHCNKNQVLGFNTKSSTEVVVNATISHVQLEAFSKHKSDQFSTARDCEAIDTPDIVPIAVGCALAGLVVIVLIAYLVGRRRAQARGYLSM